MRRIHAPFRRCARGAARRLRSSGKPLQQGEHFDSVFVESHAVLRGRLPPGAKMVPALQLMPNFPYPKGRLPEVGVFDVRPEVCSRLGFTHGQVLRVTNPMNPAEKFEMTAVGVAMDPELGQPAMWFQMAGEPGCGVFPPETLAAFRQHVTIVGQQKLQRLTEEECRELRKRKKHWLRVDRTRTNLQAFKCWRDTVRLKRKWEPPEAAAALPWPPVCDFGFPMDRGDGTPIYAEFDVRPEAVGAFTVDGSRLSSGLGLEIRTPGQKPDTCFVVGVRPIPGVHAMLWVLPEGAQAAVPVEREALALARVRNVAPRSLMRATPEQVGNKSEDPVDPRALRDFQKFIAGAKRATVRRIRRRKSSPQGGISPRAVKEV